MERSGENSYMTSNPRSGKEGTLNEDDDDDDDDDRYHDYVQFPGGYGHTLAI